MLDFIKNGAFRKACQKSPWILSHLFLDIQIFKRHTWLFWKYSLNERAFP